MLSKNADPNSRQFLHEAVFLYFIYRDLELSTSVAHKYHDNFEPDNQRKLIHLLLQYGAKLTAYKHPDSVWEYELASLRCFSNLWNQLKFGKGLNPKQMEGQSPLDYASTFKDRYQEMFDMLLKCHQERVTNEISTAIQQSQTFDSSSPTLTIRLIP